MLYTLRLSSIHLKQLAITIVRIKFRLSLSFKFFFLAKKRFNAQPPELKKFLLLQNDALIDFSSFLTPQPLRKVTLRFYGDVNSNSSTICRCTPNDGNSKIIGSRFINTLFEARGFGGLDLGERGPRV